MTTTNRRSGADIQETFAKAVIARLDESTTALPHDISERLKVARTQALSRRKVVADVAVTQLVSQQGSQASLQMGSGLRNFWTQLGSWLPLLVLVTGMVVIEFAQDDWTAQEIADVDTELLTDALPPAAYTDPGFAQFLRNQEK